MSFQSFPVVPPPITTPTADVSALWLLQPFKSRLAFQLQTGLVAPPFDPTQPARYWCDTSANPGPYKVLVGSGPSASLQPIPAPPNVGMPNFPSPYAYPQWASANTTPAMVGVGGLDPDLLLSLADANLIAQFLSKGLNTAVGVTEDTILESNGISWNGETRRIYVLSFAGNTTCLAGGLARQTFARGLDPVYGPPPGRILVTAAGSVTYLFSPEPAWAEIPVTGIPCRDLDPGEAFSSSLLGMGTQIINPSLQPQTGGGGGYTDADRTRDNQTHVLMLEIAQALNLKIS